MAERNVRLLIADSLANLTRVDFERFVDGLLDRREEPRVRRSQVEGKDRLDVTDVLVSTFTAGGAPRVVLELLRDMGCNGEAEELEMTLRGGR